MKRKTTKQKKYSVDVLWIVGLNYCAFCMVFLQIVGKFVKTLWSRVTR